MTKYHRKNTVILRDQNFFSFSISNCENLRVMNSIQIYLFLFF